MINDYLLNLLYVDDNAASARQPTLISGNLEDSDEEEDEEGNRKMKPKHIRWQLEDGKDETSGKSFATSTGCPKRMEPSCPVENDVREADWRQIMWLLRRRCLRFVVLLLMQL